MIQDRNYKEATLFISQPMSGLSNEEILKTRTRCIENFKKLYAQEHPGDFMQFAVVDNTQFDAPADYKSTDYLSNDIKWLGNSDYIYFAKGWQNSRGCNVEYLVAKTYLDPECMFFE